MWSVVVFWIILLVYIVLVVSTVTVVLLENRQPAKTIAWTIVLVMLPVVGLIIFYFFGQNIRKERYISRRQYNRLTRQMLQRVNALPQDAAPRRYIPLVRLFQTTNGSILTSVRHIDGYTTGADWVQALLREVGRFLSISSSAFRCSSSSSAVMPAA